MKIAQLIPEFPGQTHIFFWREINALRGMGVECVVVSTARPPASVVCHEWSREAMRATTYLFPPSVGDVVSALGRVLMAGPVAWVRALGVVLGRGVGGVSQRVKIAALALLGARLAGLARRQGWSHVHAQSCADSAYLALFASIFGRVTYSVALHSQLNYFGLGQQQKWGSAAFGVAVTEMLKQEVLSSVPGTRTDKIDVAPMGVEIEKFRRGRAYEPWRGGGALKLVSCGRLTVGKGHLEMVRAAATLRERGVPVELEILGEGPAREKIEALIAELKLSDVVTLRGAVAEGKVREALEGAHVFCLASHEEAIGVATMEAMAMGLPVVVTRVGGVHELVRDGVDGIMVPPQDVGAIAAAVETIARDPAMAARMGESGSARVHESFTSRRSAEVIVARLKKMGLMG